jgi:hypothetical protein
MAKRLTKTQKRNMVKAIRAKAFRLIECDSMTLADYDKIAQACKRAMNRLK